MNKSIVLLTLVITVLVGCDKEFGVQHPSETVATVSAQTIAAAKPKLILQLTVDQLRGDLPTRYYDRLGEGGLKYLLDKGVVYKNAHHAHANTETIVGHVTLATGAQPSAHGMVGNLWFDRSTGKTTYNIEDPNHRLLTEGADIDASTEHADVDLAVCIENTFHHGTDRVLVGDVQWFR